MLLRLNRITENMADEVKLYAVAEGSFVFRAKIALNLKGIEYENIEEDLNNKSADVLKYNPVHKKLPVLLHNGKPISESLVIVEYIDDVWKGVPILPQDPYEKAVARFWAKFIDDKVMILFSLVTLINLFWFLCNRICMLQITCMYKCIPCR